MKTRSKFLIVFLLTLFSAYSWCQDMQNEYKKGFAFLEKGENKKAKEVFRNIIKLDSADYGGYNFLGICFFNERAFDSTIYYLKKSIELNKNNFKHSREMTIVRLSRTYLYKKDFKNAFALTLDALNEFPDNPNIRREIQDICLWSYYIKHEGLDSTYTTNEPQKEYIVTNIPQEYLIMRNIKIDDHNLNFMRQRLVENKKNESYDILTCNINKTSDSIELKFKLNWNLSKEFGGKEYDTEKVYENDKLPIWERIGAKLTSDSKLDIITEEKKLRKK